MEDGIYSYKYDSVIRVVYKGKGYDTLFQTDIMDVNRPNIYTYICPLTKISAILYGIPENYKEIIKENEELTK